MIDITGVITKRKMKQAQRVESVADITNSHKILVRIFQVTRLRWSRGSMLAFSTQVRGFKPGRSRRIFRAKKSSARLSSERT